MNWRPPNPPPDSADGPPTVWAKINGDWYQYEAAAIYRDGQWFRADDGARISGGGETVVGWAEIPEAQSKSNPTRKDSVDDNAG